MMHRTTHSQRSHTAGLAGVSTRAPAAIRISTTTTTGTGTTGPGMWTRAAS